MFVRKLLSICLWLGASVATSGQSTDRVAAFTRTNPHRDDAVATGDGWMVPYDDPIPGEDETIRMVPVPGGNNIEPFWISATEITFRQYMPFRQLHLRARRRELQHGRHPWRPNIDHEAINAVDGITAPSEVYAPDHNFEYADQPNSAAVSMSQFAARQYTKWLSRLRGEFYRLPLQSEHVHACQSGGTKGLSDIEWPDETQLIVGRGKPNRWGIFGMRSNAAELVIEDRLRSPPFEHVVMGRVKDGAFEPCECSDATRTTRDWWDEDPDFPPSPLWMTSEEARQTGFRVVRPLQPPPPDERGRFWNPDSDELATDVEVSIEIGRSKLLRVDAGGNQ